MIEEFPRSVLAHPVLVDYESRVLSHVANMSRGICPKLGVKLWIEHKKNSWSMKNKLAKIALDGKPCASIADYLEGMTVLAYSEDPVAAAKVVDAYAKTNDKLVVLGGAMGENALDVAGVKAVAAMPSREELIASIAGCIGAPASSKHKN